MRITRLLICLIMLSLLPVFSVGAAETAPAAEKQADISAEVELFTTAWCPWCKKASNFLRRKGVPFTEYDVEKDRQIQAKFFQISPRGGVPVAIINGRVVRGFDEEIYERALKMPRKHLEPALQ